MKPKIVYNATACGDWDDPFYDEDDTVENPSWMSSFCRRIWKMFS